MASSKHNDAHPLLNDKHHNDTTPFAKSKRSQPSDDSGAIDLENQTKGSKPASNRSAPRVRRPSRCSCFCAFGYCLASIVVLGFLFLFGWMAKISWQNREHRCEEELAVWLFVTACAGLGWSVIIGVSKLVEDRCSARCEDGCDRLGNCLRVFAVLSVVIWLIIGSIWTFEMEYDHELCPRELYDFCWYLLIITWGILGFAILVALVLCCALACKMLTK